MTHRKDEDALVQASGEQTSVSPDVSDKDREESPVPGCTSLEPIDERASHSSRVVRVPVDLTGGLKWFGGSDSSAFNKRLLQRGFNSLPLAKGELEDHPRLAEAMMGGMKGIAPRDEIEGILATLLVQLNFAVLESLRCAHTDNQSFDVRWAALNQVNKGARTVATLVDALNRHRGKVQQKVRVEHVHVNHGGQAIVGSIETGKGSRTQSPRKRRAGKPKAD